MAAFDRPRRRRISWSAAPSPISCKFSPEVNPCQLNQKSTVNLIGPRSAVPHFLQEGLGSGQTYPSWHQPPRTPSRSPDILPKINCKVNQRESVRRKSVRQKACGVSYKKREEFTDFGLFAGQAWRRLCTSRWDDCSGHVRGFAAACESEASLLLYYSQS